MKSFLCVGALTAACLFFACTTETTNNTSSSGSNGTSGGTSGSSGDNSSGGTSGNTSGGTSGGSSGDTPPASTKEVDVQFNAACPEFTACGGNPSGTYDYSAGCVGDVFAQVKEACPTVDLSNAKATIKGTIYFLADNALKRDVTLKISGSITVPAACAAGQCAQAETALKGAFPSATCTAAGPDCSCTLDETKPKTSSTTFAVDGDTVTTADGETYTICEQGSTLKYTGASAGAEDGTWELTKR